MKNQLSDDDELIIRCWLIDLLDITEKLQRVAVLGEDIEVVARYESIQIYKGLDIVASAIGAEVKEEAWPEREYPFCYSFKYRGKVIFQLSKTRWEEFSDDV